MIAVQKKEKPIILFDSATLWLILQAYADRENLNQLRKRLII